MDDNPALHGALMFYSVSCYETFDKVGFERANEAADFCSTWAMEYPLYLRSEAKKGAPSEFPKRDIPHFGERSSVFAIAVMSAFLVWSQKQSFPDAGFPESSMLSAALDGWNLYSAQKGVETSPRGV